MSNQYYSKTYYSIANQHPFRKTNRNCVDTTFLPKNNKIFILHFHIATCFYFTSTRRINFMLNNMNFKNISRNVDGCVWFRVKFNSCSLHLQKCSGWPKTVNSMIISETMWLNAEKMANKYENCVCVVTQLNWKMCLELCHFHVCNSIS